MARIGITYPQVAAACDSLLSASRQVTINSVREALGNTGSPNTIHAHLTAWRSAMPVAQSSAHELPSTLLNALGQELAKAAAAARAEIEEKLVTAQSEAAQLGSTGEVLEQQVNDLHEKLTEICDKYEKTDKLSADRQIEINHLIDQVNRERNLVGQAQTEAATLRVTTSEQFKEINLLQKQVEKQTNELSINNEKCVKAEREKAVSDAQKFAAEEAKNTAVEALKVANDAHAKAMKTAADAGEKALADAKINAADRYASYEKQLQAMQDREQQLNKSFAEMVQKNADLQKRLDDELLKIAQKADEVVELKAALYKRVDAPKKASTATLKAS